jgi:hypothetical protein
MEKVRVYISSPYSNGDKEQNVQLQMDAYYHLIKLGFNPYMPTYNHFIQKNHPDIDSNFPWLEIDKAWLKDCDIAIRIHLYDKDRNEIISLGADEEELFCKENGIPMFHFDSLEEMVRTMQTFETTIQ